MNKRDFYINQFKENKNDDDDDDDDDDQHAILVSGITRDLPISKVLHVFQDTLVNGGAKIKTYDTIDNDKIKITYLNKNDADRVLARGSTISIENKYYLNVRKFISNGTSEHYILNSDIKNEKINSNNKQHYDNISNFYSVQLLNRSFSSQTNRSISNVNTSDTDIYNSGTTTDTSSSAMTTIVKNVPVTGISFMPNMYENRIEATREDKSSTRDQETTIINNRFIDRFKFILVNVPTIIDKELLELYVEYLSGEISIERIDLSREIKNTIVVTFAKPIDFISAKQKHKSRPNLLNNQTELIPVYEPVVIIVEIENNHANYTVDNSTVGNPFEISKYLIYETFNQEIIELYFSNKKRSGGENVIRFEFNKKKNCAYVYFDSHETARRVAQRKHHINNIELKVRLYYENIGPDPFIETKSLFIPLNIRKSLFTYQDSGSKGLNPNLKGPTASTIFKTNLERLNILFRTQKGLSNTDDKMNDLNLLRIFDLKSLNSQQMSYLLELQAIYNQIYNTNMNLFSTTPNPDLLKKKLHQQSHPSAKIKYIFKPPTSISGTISTTDRLSNPHSEFSYGNLLVDSSESNDLKFSFSSSLDNTIPENLNLKMRPIVNLPSLDDPILSFEEYSMLNNLKEKSYQDIVKNDTAETNINNHTNITLDNYSSTTALAITDSLLDDYEFNHDMPERIMNPVPPATSSLEATIDTMNATKSSMATTTTTIIINQNQQNNYHIPIKFNDEPSNHEEIKKKLINLSDLTTPTLIPIKNLIIDNKKSESSQPSQYKPMPYQEKHTNPIQKSVINTPVSTRPLKVIVNTRPPVPKLVRFANNPTKDEPPKQVKKLQIKIDKPTETPNRSSRQRSVYSGRPPPPKIIPKKNQNQKNLTSRSINSIGTNKSEYSHINDYYSHPSSFSEALSIRSSVGKSEVSKNHIIVQYGPVTQAETSNRLNQTQIDYFQSTRYLIELKRAFPKVSVTLNKTLKRLYFFGSQKQVILAKSRVQKDIDHFKQLEYRLSEKELGYYLQRPLARYKISKFIDEIVINLSRKGSNSNSRDDFNNSFSIYFCSYQIMRYNNKSSSSSRSKKDSLPGYTLAIDTNSINIGELVYRYIIDSIRVNLKIEILSKRLFNSIRHEEPNWTDFFDKKYRFLIDLYLDELSIKKSNSDSNRKRISKKNNNYYYYDDNSRSKQIRMFIKVTGFNDYVNRFLLELRKIYGRKVA